MKPQIGSTSECVSDVLNELFVASSATSSLRHEVTVPWVLIEDLISRAQRNGVYSIVVVVVGMGLAGNKKPTNDEWDTASGCFVLF